MLPLLIALNPSKLVVLSVIGNRSNEGQSVLRRRREHIKYAKILREAWIGG